MTKEELNQLGKTLWNIADHFRGITKLIELGCGAR